MIFLSHEIFMFRISLVFASTIGEFATKIVDFYLKHMDFFFEAVVYYYISKRNFSVLGGKTCGMVWYDMDVSLV